MNKKCACGSYAINQTSHGRKIGVDSDLCDVCYWRKRATQMADALGDITEYIDGIFTSTELDNLCKEAKKALHSYRDHVDQKIKKQAVQM